MSNIDLLNDGSELVHYDDPGIPIYIRIGNILSFPEGRVLAHWHEDIELSCVLEGSMIYDINGKKTIVREGDCIFINSSQIHFNYSSSGSDCRYICILLHPSLLGGNMTIYDRIIRPIISNKGIEYIHYDRNDEKRAPISKLLQDMVRIKNSGNDIYQLAIIQKMCELWTLFYNDLRPLLSTRNPAQSQNVILLQKMIGYIYSNYPENLSLDDISKSADISRSKCCRLFKEYVDISPIDFLNEYRLKVSSGMLTDTDMKISEIAFQCGFNSFSYYSKRFLAKYGVSPREYRSKTPINGI